MHNSGIINLEPGMEYKRVGIVICCLALASAAFADDSVLGANTPSKTGFQWHPIIGINLGAGMAQVGSESQDFVSGSGQYNLSYENAAAFEMNGAYGAFVGIEFPLTAYNSWTLQTNLVYNAITPFNVKGVNTVAHVESQNEEEFDYYDYQYSVQSQQLLAQIKLMMTVWGYFHPYISLAAGAAMNSTSGYQAQLAEPPAFPANNTPTFANAQTMGLAYGGGFGVDFDVFKSLRLGLGYQFISLGEAETGNAAIEGSTITTSGKITQSSLYEHEVLAQLTYIF